MMEKKTRRTQAERSQHSRDRIIQEAARLFAQNGYRGTTLKELAAAVNMSEAGLLYHFSNKEQLLVSVLQHRDDSDSERFGTGSKTPGFDLFSALVSLVKHNQTVPGLVKLFTVLVAESITLDNPSHDFFVGRYRNMRDEGEKALREAQEAGEIRTDIAAEDLAVMVYAMMDGLQVQWLLEPQAVDMAKLFEQFLKLLKG